MVLGGEVLPLRRFELLDPLLDRLEELQLADAGLGGRNDGLERLERQLEELSVLALENVGEAVLHAL